MVHVKQLRQKRDLMNGSSHRARHTVEVETRLNGSSQTVDAETRLNGLSHTDEAEVS